MTTLTIDEIKSVGIRLEMEKLGSTEIEYLGDNGKSGDQRVAVYYLVGGRVADTNGDPVWEENDGQLFAELLDAEGITL